jgi:peptidoglycan/xylan/chitin deacetylase (PgdA/CDA1 family)
MANKSKKSQKNTLLIYSMIFVLILLNCLGSFLIYSKYAKKTTGTAPVELAEKEKNLQRELEEIKRKTKIEQERRAAQLQAEQEAAETARMQEAIQIRVVKDFYQAINDHDCTIATQLRPNYKSCPKIEWVKIKKLKLVRETPTISVIYLEMVYQRNNREKSFSGYLIVKLYREQWIIDNNSYRSKLSLDKYLKKYKIAPATSDNSTNITPKPEPNTNFTTTTGDYGSKTILNACWTKKQLAGSPQDKKVQRPIKNPFKGHPDIYVPTHENPKLKPKLRNSIRRIIPRNNEKVVALTFDLCERTKEITGYDADLVNYLRKHKIRATFYAGGKWMHSHTEKAKQLMADPLFEIGNHAWTHGNLRVLKGEEMENQILWTQGQYEVLRNDLINDVKIRKKCNIPPNIADKEIDSIPLVPQTFRFPYGTCSAESLNFLAESGLPAVQWDIVTGDPWRKQTAKGIARTILRNKVKPGSIIIAHANGRGHGTAKSLDLFIPKLKKQGYRFVTVSELLKSAKTVETKNECYELKPGDNKRYDRIFRGGTE